MTYVSNDCLAWFIYKNKNQEYESPFIGSLFESDEQYLKFCENYDYYIKLEPRFKEPELFYTVMNYEKPIAMFLGDIEIHWPHEENDEEVLQNFKRRLGRVTAPVFLWSDMQMFNGYREDFKQRFRQIPNARFLEHTEIEAFKDKSLDDIGTGFLKIVKWFDYNILAKHI